jgi:hypothetical protein
MRRTRHSILTAIVLLAGCSTDDNRLGGQFPLDGPDGGAASGGAAGFGGSGGGTQGSGGAAGSSQAPPPEMYTAFADMIIHQTDPNDVKCIPRPLEVGGNGQVACKIAQVRPASDCGCTAPGFRPAPAGLVAAARVQMQAVELCGTAGRPDCESICFCELDQLGGVAAEECLTGAAMTSEGWCYIDPSQGNGSEAVVMGCPDESKRKIRFSDETSALRPFTVLACAEHGQWPGLGPEANGEIGAACTPSSEDDPSFWGFDANEVSVELGSRQCSSGVCLANHFTGRVTCPYGQDELNPSECLTPGSGDPVWTPVRPQDAYRRSTDAVYCSCRCAGPGPGPFCPCPQGYSCTPLVDDIGLPASSAIAGSYCIKEGTEYRNFPGPDCNRSLLNCE